MTYSVGYWVDLTSIQLSDGDTPSSWIQAMTVGKYDHPVYGEIDFSPERIKRFADNVNAKVRGIDPDIDYDHKAATSEAAGWIKQAEVRSNGLWVFVEWTKEAAAKIRNRAYRYFSPEFVDEWKHPSSGQTFKDVLFGGGITNRPFLKDILPLNLSELLAEPKQKPTGGTSMDPKLLRELLGLREDATDAEITAAITKLKETPPPPAPPAPSGSGGNVSAEDALKKLAEGNPAIKLLLDRQEAQDKELAETRAALRLSEVSTGIARLSEGKDWAFPAVVLNELPPLMVQMPKTLSDKVFDVLKKLAETGLVQLGEKGRMRKTGESETDPVKKFTEAVGELIKKDPKLGYAEAVDQIALMEPQLFDEYRKASYAGREN